MAQKPERRVEMPKNRRSSLGRGALFALFRLFARFAYHRMAGSGPGMKAFGPSRRFSSLLWCSRRSPQLLQKGGHRPAHLRQRRKRGTGLPWPIAPLCQRTSQHQQIMRASDDLRPAFGTPGRTEPWLIPEQLLFVKAIAMLMGVAQAIGWADLGQRNSALALPDKPTDPGVTRTVCGSVTNDLDHAHLDLPSRAQVQVVPAVHLDAPPFGVQPFPALVWFAMAALVLTLKALSILTTGSQLTGQALWGGTVEDAVAFDSQEAACLHVGQPPQERHAGVPAISDNDGLQATCQQQGHHGPQLASGHLGDQFTRGDAGCVQDEGALPGLPGQEHHVTENPAWAGRVRVPGQIGEGNQRAILGGLGLGAVQVAGVYTQKHELPCLRQRREIHTELAQALGIDLAVFQRLVQTGPGSLKKRRERQFGEAAGSRFTGERIHQIEQGVLAVAKAGVHPVTKVLQCVKVHPSNAPEFDVLDTLLSLSNSCQELLRLL